MLKGTKRLASEAEGAVYRRVSAHTMARIEACAIIAASEEHKGIDAIMTNTGMDRLDASRLYIFGAIKRRKRIGLARSIVEAVEQIELKQQGDLRPALYPSTSTQDVARINSVNGNGYTLIAHGRRVAVGKDKPMEYKRPSVDVAKIYSKVVIQEEAKLDAYTVEAAFIERNAETMAAHAVMVWKRNAPDVVREIMTTGATGEDISKATGGELRKLARRIRYGIIDSIPVKDTVELVRRYAV